MKLTLNANKLIAEKKQEVKSRIDKSLDVYEEELIKNTPVDTGNFLSNHTKNEASVEGSQIKGSIYNDTEYGIYVEYGIGNIPMTYSTVSGPFTSDAGNRTFTRTLDTTKPFMLKILNGG